ncbi:hypothetical protein CHLNCDRAFT_141590 [Chlorella variabilis]|uniref:MYND-type domain-containing protein n=1 Tax=Chlorella variabilis TaxID=554065 RepID=E1ZT99_CHLVA|nr:hypothetical protein CHLNCDRAFT_141590 [Chlorella variabilis]EFN50962.1 hypothetical protein CHLNCDRAFT_141590 [Chlorella variabilis]|eukprot:XP_005843064.1 hypothetical protein CHLNCDRAFT_141590 [Chlorella variabilis]
MSSSGAAPAAPLVGEQFLERRLRRAAAIPIAERGPDVAAFLESVQLQREVQQALPITATGQPALVGPRLRHHLAVMWAFAKCVKAIYICPELPPLQGVVRQHLAAYLPMQLDVPPDVPPDAAPSGSGTSSSSSSSGSGGSSEELSEEGAVEEALAAVAEDLRGLSLWLECTATTTSPDPNGDVSQSWREVMETVDRSNRLMGLLEDAASERLMAYQLALLTQLAQHLLPVLDETPHGQLPSVEKMEVSRLRLERAAPLQPLLTLQQLQHVHICTMVHIVNRQLLLATQHLGVAQVARWREVRAAVSGWQAKLLALEPVTAKSCFFASDAAWLAEVHEGVGGAAAATRPLRSNQLMQRAFQLGQAEGSDFWTAVAGSMLLTGAVRGATWLGVADRGMLEAGVAAAPAAMAAARRGKGVLPEAWSSGMQSLVDPAQYCSRACQVAHWPAHKAQCRRDA